MWLNELWQRWMDQAPRQLRRRCRPSGTRTRLTLEALEERTLLSNPATAGDLIAAINKANSSGTSTTITLQTGSIFNFISADNSTNGANALPVITGKITIVGNNDTLVRTGLTQYRLFDVAGGGSLNLQNLTLQGGKAQGMGAAAEGGAIYSSGTLNLSGVTVKSNAAVGSNGLNAPTGGGTRGTGGMGANAFGGGLYVAGGSVSLDNVILSGNLAQGGNGGHGSNAPPAADCGSGGNGGEAAGGGLYVAGGSFSLSNDTLSGNRAIGGQGGNGGIGSQKQRGGDGGAAGAGEGGGLYVAAAAGSLTLSNDTFSGNIAVGGSSGGLGGNGAGGGKGGNGAQGEGGGLYVAAAGSLTLSRDTLSGNFAAGGNGANGGKGSNSSIVGFTGGAGGAGAIGSGGGLYVENGSITLVNDTIAGNRALGGIGGGGGKGGNGGTFIFSAYDGGIGGAGGAGGAGAGGGLYVNQGSVTLLNNTLSGNLAQGGAGGIGGAGGAAGVNAFAQGKGGTGGAGGTGGDALGGGFDVPAFNVTYSLVNTLIAENNLVDGTGGVGGEGGASVGSNVGANGANGSNGNASGPDVSGTVLSSDHDLIGDGAGSSLTNNINGDQVGTDASPINPQLGPLQNNGGPTETMALLANSPAIDKGDNNATHLPKTDQRGFPRIVGSAVDIGAFEFGAKPGVSIHGTQMVIIGDPSGTSSNDSATVEVNASGGVSAVLNGATTSFNPGQVTSIFIDLGGGSNTITVLGTPVGVTTDIAGDGSDTVNVGNGATKNIRGDVNIESAADLTNIIVNDATDISTHNVTFSNIGANPADSESDSDPWGQISGLLGNANVDYEIADTAGVTVLGSNGASTYNILSTLVGLAVDAGNSSDTFNVGNGNSLGGIQAPLTIGGGEGTNTLNANDSSSASGQSYSLSFTQLTGSDFAPITYAPASFHALHITGSGNDTLNVLGPVIATTFNGGSGTNTLVGPTYSSLTTWTISGVNSGKLDGVAFSNFQNLVGGESSDLFKFTTSTASISGFIDGGGGTNSNNALSYSPLGSSYLVSVTLTSNTAGSATHIGGGFSNINSLLGSTDTANTLTGPNSTNEWIITGNNAGDVNTGPILEFVFTGIGNLVGGPGVDTFRMHSTSSKARSLNGGGAPAGQGDWLKYSEFPSSSTVTVNLATGSATNINGGAAGAVTNIQNVLGSATGTNQLTGNSQGNILIGGSGLNTIVGGSGSSLLIGGSGHGSITGGSGSDILIAGFTAYNPLGLAGVDSLMAILAELQSTDTFADKVYDLIHGTNVGDPAPHGQDLNGANKLTWGGTVRASTAAFALAGDTSASAAADWFFSQSPSTVSDFSDDGVNDEHNNNAIGVF